ncbi:hypothetical protein CRUP_033281 [Coryphaenoides rupestris]|nr:hypothetical protein CRUP_033281 [Coryphaenoides rupestris]
MLEMMVTRLGHEAEGPPGAEEAQLLSFTALCTSRLSSIISVSLSLSFSTPSPPPVPLLTVLPSRRRERGSPSPSLHSSGTLCMAASPLCTRSSGGGGGGGGGGGVVVVVVTVQPVRSTGGKGDLPL